MKKLAQFSPNFVTCLTAHAATHNLSLSSFARTKFNTYAAAENDCDKGLKILECLKKFGK